MRTENWLRLQSCRSEISLESCSEIQGRPNSTLKQILKNLSRPRYKRGMCYELEGAELEKRKFTYPEIVDSTQNFSSQYIIGKGGSSTVYKAVVRDKGTLAVKKLFKSSMTGLNEFINEIRTLELMKNDNLVQLLGWCAGDDQHLLIYEYMEENSLRHVLFEKKLKLCWGDRYRICVQIAMGLVYLHETSDPKIIHRDITPSNILLDKNLNAKISDFGLARFYNEEQNHLSTVLWGTHGYMAPEYALRGLLSVKTDVYSYGVVILEIVSGESNANEKPNQESQFLLDQAYIKHKAGRLLDLVDKFVTSMEDYSQEEAYRILSLAVSCTQLSPTLRPTMSEVLSVLKGYPLPSSTSRLDSYSWEMKEFDSEIDDSSVKMLSTCNAQESAIVPVSQSMKVFRAREQPEDGSVINVVVDHVDVNEKDEPMKQVITKSDDIKESFPDHISETKIVGEVYADKGLDSNMNRVVLMSNDTTFLEMDCESPTKEKPRVDLEHFALQSPEELDESDDILGFILKSQQKRVEEESFINPTNQDHEASSWRLMDLKETQDSMTQKRPLRFHVLGSCLNRSGSGSIQKDVQAPCSQSISQDGFDPVGI